MSLTFPFREFPIPGVMVLPGSPNFEVVSVNEAGLTALGLPFDCITGQSLFSRLNFSKAAELKRMLEDILSGSRKQAILKNCSIAVPGSQRQKTFNLKGAPVKDHHYNISHILLSLEKVSPAVREIDKQRFSELFFQAPVGIGLTKGPDHRWELANPRLLQLIPQKEVIGKTVRQVNPELESQGFLAILDKVYKTGDAYSGEESLVKFAGQGNGEEIHKYVSFLWQAHRNEAGEIDGLLLFAMDVTEQVMARRKIEESEKKFREIVETAQEGILKIREDQTITYVNDKMCDMLGYSPEEVLGQKISALIQEGSEQVTEKLRSSAQEEQVQQSDLTIISKAGKEIFTRFSMNPLFKETGGMEFLAMVMDISESKRNEERLIKSEQRLKDAQEIARFGSWDFNFATQLQTYSEEACRIYGLAPEENQLTTEEWLSFIHPEDLDELKAEMEESSRDLRESTYSHRIILRDGTIKYIFAKAAFEFDSRGVPTGVFGIVQDVTDLRSTELNLEQQNKELVKINKELDRFVYSASHDLRSPLTSIMGLISIIEEISEEKETLEYVRMIGSSIQRLDGFIKNILKYSRNNRTEIEPERLHLKENIQEVVGAMRNMKEAERINFEVEVSENEVFYSDRQRFTTILENLISNAIKYHAADQENPYIRIKAETCENGLELTISDNGVGISSGYHQKIFDMFFRISSQSDGSGIGLYIVKDTVERIGGTVRVSSEEGRGATFFVNLRNMKE